MPSFQVNLYLETQDGQSWAPEGPGWYIDVRGDMTNNPPGVEVGGRRRITPGEAEQLAQVFDRFVTDKASNYSLPEDRRSNLSIHEASRKANTEAVTDLQAILDQIEQQAQSIPALRARLGEFQ